MIQGVDTVREAIEASHAEKESFYLVARGKIYFRI